MTIDNYISPQYRNRLLADLEGLEKGLTEGRTLKRLGDHLRKLVLMQARGQIRRLEESQTVSAPSGVGFAERISDDDPEAVSSQPPRSGFLLNPEQLHRLAYGLPCTAATHQQESLVRIGVSAMARGDLMCGRSVPSWVQDLGAAGEWSGTLVADWVRVGRFMSTKERIKETARMSGCDAATIVDCTLDACVPFFHTVACPSCFATNDVSRACAVCARRSHGLCASTICDDSDPRETVEGWLSRAQYIDGFVALVNTASEDDLATADILMELYAVIGCPSDFSGSSTVESSLRDVLNLRFVQGGTVYLTMAVNKPAGPGLELWERCQHAAILWNDVFDVGYDMREGGSLNTALYCHKAGLGLDHVALYLRGLIVEAIDHLVANRDGGPLRALLYSIAFHYSCARYCHWIELSQVCSSEHVSDEYGVRNWSGSPKDSLFTERRDGFASKLASGIRSLGGTPGNSPDGSTECYWKGELLEQPMPRALGTMPRQFYRACGKGPNGSLAFPWAELLDAYAACVSVGFDPVGLAQGWSRLAGTQT